MLIVDDSSGNQEITLKQFWLLLTRGNGHFCFRLVRTNITSEPRQRVARWSWRHALICLLEAILATISVRGTALFNQQKRTRPIAM